GLRKILDDTNVARVQMGSQIENLKEELTFLRKNHQEVEKLKAQIANSSVSVRVNDRKNVDLGDIMSKIREKYEKIADQNREDIEQMYQTKFQDLSQAVARGNDAVQLAKRDANNLRCQVQPLEAELNGLLIQNRSLEQTLGDTEDRWNSELDELNRTIAKLEQELRMLCSHIEQQAEKYQSLLDVKCKLDREISAYQGLLEEDAIHVFCEAVIIIKPVSGQNLFSFHTVPCNV
uniref:Keratin, type I cytoskeletal 18-like n=1 Tax=Callorhinchus milii TaxID=7868 RepID=A0A4W3GUV4_CALMI